jgi:hypothetical protein
MGISRNCEMPILLMSPKKSPNTSEELGIVNVFERDTSRPARKTTRSSS